MDLKPVLDFAVKALPNDYNPDTECFFGMLLFRRKWAIHFAPEKEGELRKTFRGDETRLGGQVLYGPLQNVAVGLMQLALLRELPKIIWIKDTVWATDTLWWMYPHAISLMVTFEPRSHTRAVKKLVPEMVKRAIAEGPDSVLPAKMFQQMVSAQHRDNSRRRFVMLDFDEKVEDEHAVRIVEALRGEGLDMRYAVKTPTGGLHAIVGIDDVARAHIFKDKLEILKDLVDLRKVEVKTGQCMTHVPGVNPYVKVIYGL
ncbi:MAG: hypothetical protein GXO39_04370 [Thermotogae bacterium]|nr:hypothetical protein [Thermotogota bacterium]